MAKITSVDYVSIPGKANEIQSRGTGLNSELSKAYQTVAELQNTWHGIRYNTLISYFNDIVNEVNAMLELVINEIPEALGTVAKNYAAADGGSVASVSQGTVSKVSNLANSDTSTMAYDSNAASSAKSTVTTNIDNSKNEMDAIESIFNGIDWESEAKDAFSAKFKELKSKICSEFDTIKSQFTTLMQNAESDIQSAETSNTVD